MEADCAIKCLRNGEIVPDSVHLLKYGVNTVGRGLTNDILLKNLQISRSHCQLRVENNGPEDIAYIKDLGTSNGTILNNTYLIGSEEYKLNDLDMIVLASDEEGVVLQFMKKVDRPIDFPKSNNNKPSNKRKVMCSSEDLDEVTDVKMPKLILNKSNIFKEPAESLNPSNKSKNLSTNLQNSYLTQKTLTHSILNSAKDSSFSTLPTEEPKIALINNPEPSCSYFKDNVTSVQLQTEPSTMNSILGQGTYSNEEDSVIVISSSDEEDNVMLEKPNIKIEQEKTNLNTIYPRNAGSSTSIVQNQNSSTWSIHCQRIINVISDDEDGISDVPPKSQLKSTKSINILKNSSGSDSDSNNKCLKLIEPQPMIPKTNNKKKELSMLLIENKNIIKTRAKSAKRINNKKQTEEMTVDQNKKIIQERRSKLQQLAKNKNTLSSTEERNLNENTTNDDYIDQPSTRKKRISRVHNSHNLDCVPSTSKSHVASERVSSIDDKTVQQVSLNCNYIGSSSTIKFNPLNHAYFSVLSKICKWNALWLREQKVADQPPPLVKHVSKMKGTFENPTEYCSIVQPLLLYEIWSKISDSYSMILNKNPSFEECIFAKSLKKDKPLLTFDVQSVNKGFFPSKHLKSSSGPLWLLKCIEISKNTVETVTRSTFCLKGYLCIAIIQSNNFESTVSKKRPTKSKNIFFAYVNSARKIGFHNNAQLSIDLIVTRKTENIPNGTQIHLVDIFYLHSELRLFQALNNVATSSLSTTLITPQFQKYSDYSKAELNYYNINNLVLNTSQKNAVKMAVSICVSKEPNVGLIIGPPGTGKTNVICNIVLTLMSKHSTQTNSKPKFLICAPSNEAVDALVRRIIEIKKDWKSELQLNIVRVGNGQKYDPHSPINDVMLDNLVRQKMNNPQLVQSNSLSIFTNKKDVEKYILQNADVIVTTLNSCFSNRMEDAFMSLTDKTLNSSHFTACIVDEAGQCVEPLNYVPILLGIEKLILVGDDKQLQPVIKSKMAKDNGFGISLFKRLKTWFEHKRYTRKYYPVTMLDTQYRMHYEISLFPSEYFYNGSVKTAQSVKAREKLPFLPYIILEHESQQDGSGEINIGEAYLIMNLVEIFMNSVCKSLNIAVLTPYHKQREQINSLLEKKNISLNVNTIDSFQGGECDILLISTVRTHGIGFMDDLCRINVALTRSRQSLIICGNFMSLKGERVWCDLLENAKKRKLIKKVSSNTISNPHVLFNMIKC